MRRKHGTGSPQPDAPRGARRPAGRRLALGTLALAAGLGLLSSGAVIVAQDAGGTAPASLDETRLTLDKWLQTQQILSREARDWQQGKELLADRLDLVKTEIASLQESIAKVKAGVTEAAAKRDELLAQNEKLKATGAQLVQGVAAMEVEVRRLFKALPEPVRTRLLPLFQRIPEDAAKTQVSAAERYQNVLGILNEVNKANSELTVGFEVRNLSDGRPAEVQTLYVGLGQAYYVSANGEAGIGRPGPDGWTWEARNAIAGDVLLALDILQGKHSPAFVPLPVKLQ